MKTRVRIPFSAFTARVRGFTILELLVAIAVLAILVGIGVPSFIDVVRNNRIAAASANFVAALTLARDEALKRGTRVSMCPAEDQDSCADTTDWSSGWIVFADDFGDAGVVDEADTILQIWAAPGSEVTVLAEDAATFSFTSRARALRAQEFTVSKEGCIGNQQRVVEVSIAGRIGLTRQDCP